MNYGFFGKVMRRNSWFILFLFLPGMCVVSSVGAVDCDVVKQELKAERSLKKKRQILRAVISQCPDDPDINYKYALSLERFRKYEEALIYYQKAVFLNPEMGKAYAGLGDIFIYQGRLVEALNAYHIARQLMPESKRIMDRLIRLEVKKKALEGGVVSVAEFIKVMAHRGKITSQNPLLLTGPALQYQLAFRTGTSKLLPTGIRQIAAVGQAMHNDALKETRYEISVYATSSDLSSSAAFEESRDRANSIKNQLITNFFIDPQRLMFAWYGDKYTLQYDVGGEQRYVNDRVEFKRLVE